MKFNRTFVLAAICLAASLISLGLFAAKPDFLNSIELKLRDARFRTRGGLPPDSRVVVVAIDPKSVRELGRWPWDRKVIARLLERLKQYGARTVALDIVFSEPSDPASDNELAAAMRRDGNVAAGFFFRREKEGKKPVAAAVLRPVRINMVKMENGAREAPVMAYPEAEANIPLIARAAASAGFFNIIQDRDGILRMATLVAAYRGDIYPSLPLSALRLYFHDDITLDVARYGVDGVLIGDRRVPADESGRLAINYYGGQGAFRTISAADVIKGRLEKDELKDALVFVGATETGISDVKTTPLDPVLPGVEVHATIASNILQGNFLVRDGRVIALEVLFIFLFPLALALLLRIAHRTVTALVLFLGVAGAYFMINNFLFARYFLDTGIIYPAISLGLTYLGSEAYRNFIEERQGRFLKKAFSSYVSPDLVSVIIKNPDMLKLGGEQRVITVLFSDIRGFTTLSEKMEPEPLVRLLNLYLRPMTDIILRHNGTLDKYIGDAIMAIFNAPLTIEGHPARACASAVEMLEKLKEVNAGFREMGLPELDIGIGINTGNVIVGNMGTDMRFDYTAIGDTVNLASRLEGMNKVYKTRIIVSESTRKGFLQAADTAVDATGIGRATPAFREVDLIKVKGKGDPVTIYELSTDMDRGLITGFEGGLALYRQQRFKEALLVFGGIEEKYKDGTSGVFGQRCREFIDKAPGPGWDGIYVAKTK